MKIKKIAIAAALIIIAGIVIMRPFGRPPAGGAKDLYYCPMHPNFTSDKPGDCAICGMSLVKRQTKNQPSTGQTAEKGKKKILYYRNPMNPSVTSPVPMKDEMGMDYVPVYEGQQQETAGAVNINPQKQQLIGVKKEKIVKRRLTGQISTVGIVAFDPDLYVAQEEYLQTIQAGNLTKEPSNPFLKAARRKLLLLGMGKKDIEELEKQGKPQQDLYLPEDGNVWVYITIYEYEIDLVKENQPVQIETSAYPGRIFEGNIISVAPILDKTVRTLKVRALVKDPESKLKPEMYVDVKILYDLGEKLAVPEQAVMDSGTKKIVYITEQDGYFKPAQVILGPKAQGYYEVLDGLSENQTVVTSGNFLIDSESKLNAVLTQIQEPNQ
ncbi:MAG: efflux RND transporter periplasmic adaptor subunit [Sedimentisphaerales bacterium]